MVDSKHYLDWLAMAKKDYRAAQILFEHEADNSMVCFHCQQAIEKYFNGYLLKKMAYSLKATGLLNYVKCVNHTIGIFMIS